MFAGIGAVGRIGRPGLSGKKGTSLLSGMTLSLDFLQPGTLDPRITFTRASSATYTDASGIIQSATTNAPRWDYDPITHALRGLLIEEQRTNLSDASVPTVGALSAVTMVANSGIAPDNTNSLVKMNNTTASSFHGFQHAGPASPGSSYSCSIYAKLGQIRYLQIIFDDLGGGQPASMSTFDLQTGTISSSTSPSFMINVGNGIYRCGMGSMSVGAGTTQARIGINNCTIPNPGFYDNVYVGVPTDGTYLWGVQMERGAFVTSYIPTAGAAVTRAQDQCGILSASMLPWFATTGSWMAEFAVIGLAVGGGRIVGAAVTADSGIGPLIVGATPFPLGQWDGASYFATTNNTVIGVVQKGAHTSSGSGGAAKMCLNGGPVATITITNGFASLATSGIRFLNTVAGVSVDNGNGHLRRVLFWNNRILSDAEMQQVTT